ncbi:hypothetical protein HanIR_Chr07g0314631 [Helianthus annuus]|nr:hypothetical protein HanIR_Chr07g0314631 [Helianthus annuus]
MFDSTYIVHDFIVSMLCMPIMCVLSTLLYITCYVCTLCAYLVHCLTLHAMYAHCVRT